MKEAIKCTFVVIVLLCSVLAIVGCAVKRPVTATTTKVGINLHVPKSCVVDVLRTGCDISVSPAKCKHTYVTYNAVAGCEIVEVEEKK